MAPDPEHLAIETTLGQCLGMVRTATAATTASTTKP